MLTTAETTTLQAIQIVGVPKGVRTPVTAVKGQCPRPLDDGDLKLFYKTFTFWWSQAESNR
ncbi:MAG: Uncharacterized protein CG439_2208 [Methylococcaceae bacterium NSP1-2]|nr:MAG: Uncharacterized protein CG439_2208 [Methylococcaceae bacterium NSP1-2]